MNTTTNTKRLLAALSAIAILLTLASCSAKKDVTAGGSSATGGSDGSYIIMEKVLADQPGRMRTTLKILIPAVDGKQVTAPTLTKALEDIKKADPALSAVIIWAYRKREELNGSSFTVGKLEWASDGKDFNNQRPLTPNPKVDALIP